MNKKAAHSGMKPKWAARVGLLNGSNCKAFDVLFCRTPETVSE